jgi:LuxR family maltose regulon positive regulatory protein
MSTSTVRGTAGTAGKARAAAASTATVASRQLAAAESGQAIPLERHDTVPRARLVNRLRVAHSARLVLITAPAGYGKTTLVADWARRDGRPFAWHAIASGETGDALIDSLVRAVARLAPDQEQILTDLTVRTHTGDGVARLAAAIEAAGTPVVLVLDDVERIRDPSTMELVSRIVAEVPPGSQLVLSSRALPDLPVARFRAQGDLLELGVDQLRFSDREAAALIARAGVDVRRCNPAALNERLEGWPAGLSLASLVLRTPRPRAADRLPGESMMVDYLRSETLSELSEEELQLLTRCSVLDRLCGSVCDAVAGVEGSAALLDALERSGTFVVALDRERTWFRIHGVFRSILAAELERREPGRATALLGLASDWNAVHGNAELALEYARRAQDAERLIDLIGELLLPFSAGSDPAEIARLLGPLDDDTLLETHPRVAAVGALAWSMAGCAEAADRWADFAIRATGADANATAATDPCMALIRSLMRPHGADEMAAEARAAAATLPFDSPWRGPTLLALGVATALARDGSHAESALGEAAGAAASVGAAPLEAAALGLHSLVAAQRGAWRRSDRLAEAARKVVRDGQLDNEVTSLFAYTAGARAALRHGDWAAVRSDLAAAGALLPRLTAASGTMSVLLRTELASVHLALGEAQNAERLLDEADEVFVRSPEFEGLRTEAKALRDQIAANAARVPGRAPTLTAAELRLLPLLTTHLSFREIAERLFVSRNTVKTQAISVYRKLGVSSRGEAVAHASDMGLVSGADERDVR